MPTSGTSASRSHSEALVSWDLPEDDGDDAAVERRKVQRLLRVMSLFIAWPSLTAGLAFVAFEGVDVHLHIVTLPIGFAALAVFAMAPKLAGRFVKA